MRTLICLLIAAALGAAEPTLTSTRTPLDEVKTAKNVARSSADALRDLEREIAQMRGYLDGSVSLTADIPKAEARARLAAAEAKLPEAQKAKADADAELAKRRAAAKSEPGK